MNDEEEINLIIKKYRKNSEYHYPDYSKDKLWLNEMKRFKKESLIKYLGNLQRDIDCEYS